MRMMTLIVHDDDNVDKALNECHEHKSLGIDLMCRTRQVDWDSTERVDKCNCFSVDFGFKMYSYLCTSRHGIWEGTNVSVYQLFTNSSHRRAIWLPINVIITVAILQNHFHNHHHHHRYYYECIRQSSHLAIGVSCEPHGHYAFRWPQMHHIIDNLWLQNV